MMRKAVLGLTREQVAGGLVSFIQGLEAEVSRQSAQEVCKILTVDSRTCACWALPKSPGNLYIEVSLMHALLFR